jgi:hypothetical protein
MFGRKKKAAMLALFGAAGEEVYRGELAAWKLPEREVVRLSIGYFDDPEPCEIHRAAVCQRAFLEVIEAHLGAALTPVERLGAEKAAWFPGAARFSVWEEER